MPVQTSGSLLNELFEASYVPSLTIVSREELKKMVAARVEDLTRGLDRTLSGGQLVEELDRRVYGYMDYVDWTMFATDFALEGRGNCAVYANLIFAVLERLGRKDVMENIGVKRTCSHVWLTYHDGSSSFEINARSYESGEEHPIKALIAVNLNNKGNVFFNSRQHNEALECYDKALDLEPEYATAWCNRGSALGALGRNEEALECFDKALELDPDYTDARYNRCVTLYELGRRNIQK